MFSAGRKSNRVSVSQRLPTRLVKLQVQIDAGKLVIEATGSWPVLDFEKGKLVVLAAASNDEFYVDGGDHTRIAFVRNATGKVSGAVLNPGPWQQDGVKLG
jgi:hypothetical protein